MTWDPDREVADLRSMLLQRYGSDFNSSDDELRAVLEKAKARVERSGRRWSRKVLAAEDLKRAHDGP
jgi:hypothetical protein